MQQGFELLLSDLLHTKHAEHLPEAHGTQSACSCSLFLCHNVLALCLTCCALLCCAVVFQDAAEEKKEKKKKRKKDAEEEVNGAAADEQEGAKKKKKKKDKEAAAAEEDGTEKVWSNQQPSWARCWSWAILARTHAEGADSSSGMCRLAICVHV